MFVMVEHFSKTVVLMPTRYKEPATVAEAFTREVLTRYGAPAEVVTDRGGEFGGAFQECLDAALVDHRATSAYHPQANGRSERIVQVVKRPLHNRVHGEPGRGVGRVPAMDRHGLQLQHAGSAGGFLPLPAVAREGSGGARDDACGCGGALQPDDEARLRALMQERAELFRRLMPMAMGNLQIAQHRDTLQYAHTRRGGWKPKVVQYAVGDFVYL
jgi:transposase InsO family protein